MTVNHVFTGLPVADFRVARAWYERLLGGPPDLTPHATEAAWRLAGDVCWIYVVEDLDRAGSALLTVLVDDLDVIVADPDGARYCQRLTGGRRRNGAHCGTGPRRQQHHVRYTRPLSPS